MQSNEGYANVIQWISENALDRDLIINSFDQCGITSNDHNSMHSQLRHFRNTNQILPDYIDYDDGTGDLNGFDDFYESQDEANGSDTDESMSESDDDREE